MISRERLRQANKVANRLLKIYHPYEMDEERTNHFRGIYRKVRKHCSCPLCGNPRKWFKQRTRKEAERE